MDGTGEDGNVYCVKNLVDGTMALKETSETLLESTSEANIWLQERTTAHA